MADKIFHSTAVTFVDMTDSRTLDVYISSNHPTVQLCDTNKTPLEYTPDWSVTHLNLEASFYLDSAAITPEKVEWYAKIGTTETLVGNTSILSINTNSLSSNPIITYICKATYDTLSALKEITFVRVDTGLDGKSGSSAPVVQAQYSVDGKTGWTSVLNAATHKYIRYSYDGGKTWTTEIKMVGEDGTSVKIKGTATSKSLVSGTSYYTLVYNSATITGATIGDAYLLDGNLYVCVDSRDGNDYFMDVGHIQGPQGNDGKSSYVFIRYATDASGSNMSASPSSTTTHIGICTVNTNVAPTTSSSYTWSKFVGDSAKSIILSGDSQVFKMSASNVATPATIKVTAQAFNTSATTWTYSTNGGQTFVSTAPTGVTRNGNVVTITGASLTSNSLVVKASDNSVEDVFTVYKAFDGANGSPGAPGTPASMAFLTNENVTFSANASGQITATSITTNVVAYNGATKTTPELLKNTDGSYAISNLPTGMTATVGAVVNNEVPIVFTIANSATLGSVSSNNGAITIPITSPVNTNLILSWSKVNAGPQGPQGNKGDDAYMVMLTNEAHIFAGDVDHAYADSVTTQILGYKGTTSQSITIKSVDGKSAATTDTDTSIAGLKFKCSALSGTSPTITFTCTESFISASGYIPIVVSVNGVEFTRMFSYSIAFKGATGGTGSQGPQGAAATSYWLVSSASAVQKTSTGTITVTPSTLTFTSKKQTGTNTPENYACRWIIDYSTDGATYANLYTSTANEASKTVTVATTYKTIRARMYIAGGTTALLDEQIIPVVTDGAKGDKGDTGRGVSKITEYYLATTASSDVTTSTSGWTEAVQTIDITKKYLWNYELITYTDNTTNATTPVIIGVFGNTGATGKGISSVAERYLATTLSGGVTTSTSGWTPEIQTLTSTKKYLWNYEIITYTDGTTSTISPVIIGVYGDKGDKGSQGDRGVGISSVTVTYGTSTSASTQPTSWQTTLPTVAEGSYLWTRTVTDYTDTSIADTLTLTYAKQGVKGDTGSSGTSVTVSKIEYQAGTSATTAPTGTWSNGVVAVAEGNYLWTKTTFSDGKVAYGVAKQGAKGSAGADAYTVILTNESHVFAGNVSSAIASSATTQVMAYKGSTSQSVTIVSVDGKTASTSSTATSIAGLSFACSALSGTSPTITFTCTTSFVSPSGTIPIVVKVDGVTITKMFTYGIAFKGATGSQGTTGTAASLVDITPSAHYFKSTTGKDGIFTPDYIYLYPRFQTVTFSKWEYSINGGTTWVAASGANGISIGEYNSVKNTLRIARTSTLYTDTVTSISFKCVSSTESVYDTVSVAKIYDVVDLQIGGRNLVLNSNQNITSTLYKTATYDMSEDWIGGETYTVSIKGSINEGQTFGIWANGSGTRVATLTYDASKKIYTSTFVASTSIVTQTAKTLHVYNTPSDTATESSIEWIKLEKGNKVATDWSPAPEDLSNITFQIYAPKGYLLTNELASLTLETFAYEGSIEIASGATFQWSHLIDDVWINISGATDTTLTVAKADVLKSKSYRCVMTYKEKAYTSTITVQDKTDTYNSIMCISSNTTNNDCYWVLHTVVYSDADEVDPLLGPISIGAPADPVKDDYWYSVDTTNATVTLKKYDGTSWVNSTDAQSLSYSWNIMNDGSAKIPLGTAAKVKVISCHDFTNTATIMCEVSNVNDGVLTQSSLSLTDASDPIVSDTEPTATVNGQIWIKRNANGTYLMFVWDENTQSWISSDMDSRSKVHTSKPSTYNAGDLWITASNNDYGGYYALATTYSSNIKYYVLSNGVYTLASVQPTSDAEILASQYYRYITYLQGTLLQAKKSGTTYNAADWSPTLRYDNDFDDLKDRFEQLSQYVSISTDGLRMAARNENDELSPFTALFTSTDLSFYQNSEKLLILANNQLTAPRVVVEDALEVQGSISLGDLRIIIENNGSFSFAIKQ